MSTAAPVSSTGVRSRGIAPRSHGRPWTFCVLRSLFICYAPALHGPMLCIYVLSFHDLCGGWFSR
jgi:putative spermidine/putrescine transport system permease protein